MNDNVIITISRQYGSGGKEVAEMVAEKLGVRCYDRQIVYLAAEKMGETDSDIEGLLEMAYRTPESFLGSLGNQGYESIPYYNKMFREQAKVIHKIAEKESAIFLGRCADVIVRDFPNHYSFFIYADNEFRAERAKVEYNKTLKELEKENKTREKYYNYYTGQKWGDPKNYDLMINTSKLLLSEAADMIVDYVERRKK